MFCSTCGSKVGASWYACSTCGTPLARSAAPSGSRPTAAPPPPAATAPRGGLTFWQMTLAVFTGSWVLPMLASFLIACVVCVGGMVLLGAFGTAVATSVPKAPRTPALVPPAPPRWTPIADFPTPVLPVEPARVPAPPASTPPSRAARPSPSPTLVIQDGARWERQAGGLWRVTRADGSVEYLSQGPPR